MLTILVPTDFSANAKAGLRFAMHWSAIQPASLVFIHIFQPVLLPGLGDKESKYFVENEMKRLHTKLSRYVLSLYKSLGLKPGKYSCLVKEGIAADISLLEYCRHHDEINYICISTRGAGNINQFFGTNTGNLITKSKVPVVAVPVKYRRQTLKSLLFTTDLSHLDSELKRIVAFARPLKIRILLFHLVFPGEFVPDKKQLENSLLNKFRYDIKVNISKVHIENSIRENIREQIKKTRPSLVAMFTDQNRNIFQKLFYPSKAEQLSFKTTVPLLTFPKSES